MNRLHSVAAMAALLGLACGDGRARRDGPVVLHANNSAELAALPRDVAKAQADGATHVEVVLAPGAYTGTSLTLRDPHKPPTLRLDIRSAGPGPAVLRNTNLSLRAQTIRLSGLVIEDWQGPESPVQLAVGASLAVSGVTFQRLAPRGSPAVHIQGIKKTGPKTILIEDSWLRDSTAEHLILADARAADPITSLELRGVGFSGNTAQALIFGYAVRALDAHEIAVADPNVGSLLWCAWPENTASLTGSALSLSGTQDWLRRDANPPDPTTVFSEPMVTDTVLKAPLPDPAAAPSTPRGLLRLLRTP